MRLNFAAAYLIRCFGDLQTGAEDSASINHPVNGARVAMFTCVRKKMLMMGADGGNGGTAK